MRHAVSAIASVIVLAASGAVRAEDSIPAAGVLTPTSTVASLYDNRGTITGETKPARAVSIPAPAHSSKSAAKAKPHTAAIHSRPLPPLRQRPTISPVYAASVASMPEQVEIAPPPPAPVYQPQPATRGLFGTSAAPQPQYANPQYANQPSGGGSLGSLFAPAKRSTYGERGLVVSGNPPAAPANPGAYAPQPAPGRIY